MFAADFTGSMGPQLPSSRPENDLNIVVVLHKARARRAALLAVSSVISRFIPSPIRPLGRTQCSCLFPHINAFLSFLSPRMKISWLPEREVIELFPSPLSPRAESGGGERDRGMFGGEKKVLLTRINPGSGFFNRGTRQEMLKFLRKFNCVRRIMASPSGLFQNDLMLQVLSCVTQSQPSRRLRHKHGSVDGGGRSMRPLRSRHSRPRPDGTFLPERVGDVGGDFTFLRGIGV